MDTAQALRDIEQRRGAHGLLSTIEQSIGPEAWQDERATMVRLHVALATQDETLLGRALMRDATAFIASIDESSETMEAVDAALNEIYLSIDDYLDDPSNDPQQRKEINRGAL